MATVAQPSRAVFQELTPPLAPEAALVEADRCLECGGPHAEAPCVVSCPANVDVPAFVAAVARDEPDEAARIIFAENLLGGTCARVCPVELLCEGACVLRHEGRKPVAVGRLQRFATDHALASGVTSRARALQLAARRGDRRRPGRARVRRRARGARLRGDRVRRAARARRARPVRDRALSPPRRAVVLGGTHPRRARCLVRARRGDRHARGARVRRRRRRRGGACSGDRAPFPTSTTPATTCRACGSRFRFSRRSRPGARRTSASQSWWSAAATPRSTWRGKPAVSARPTCPCSTRGPGRKGRPIH